MGFYYFKILYINKSVWDTFQSAWFAQNVPWLRASWPTLGQGGGFLVQRSIRGRAAEMGLTILENDVKFLVNFA